MLAFRDRPIITLAALLFVGAAFGDALSRRVASAHKFYTSIARAEYNAETKSLEVSARIFADDLEAALTKRAKRPVSLDGTKEADALLLAYLRETFVVRDAGGGVRRVQLIGKELKVDVAWVYFEVSLPDGLKNLELRQQLLCEYFPEQINVVQLIAGAEKTELVFKSGDSFQKIALNKANP